MWLALALAHAGRGLTWIEPPHAADGELSARVRAEAPEHASELALVVDGAPLPTRARRAADEGTATLLSFDGSGSFRRHHARAFALAEALVAERAPTEAVGTLVFGRTAEHVAPSTDPDAVRAALDAARAEGAAQPETRLAAFVREAVDRVAEARPGSEGGVRRVVVFTDAGEESGVFPVEEVAEHARARRAVVDAVVFVREGSSSFAEDLDRISRLCALTGGAVVEIGAGPPPPERVLPLTRGLGAMWELTAPWCGGALPEVGAAGAGGAWADARRATGVVRPCAAAPAAASRPDGPTPAPSAGWTGPQDPVVERAAGLLCLLTALLAFASLALLGGWVARRASSAASPPPAPAPAPKPVEPPASPPIVSPSGQSDETEPFPMSLPERHLEVVAGDLPVGRRWRFSGRILRVGADGERNDVVVELPQVSGSHARFELFPSGAVYVEDLGSANGTWVGSRRLRPHERVEVPSGARVALSAQVVVRVVEPEQGR